MRGGNDVDEDEEHSADLARLIRVPDWFAYTEEYFSEYRSYIRQEFASIAEAEAFAPQYGVMRFRDSVSILQRWRTPC